MGGRNAHLQPLKTEENLRILKSPPWGPCFPALLSSTEP
jgi:hypothetical protein